MQRILNRTQELIFDFSKIKITSKSINKIHVVMLNNFVITIQFQHYSVNCNTLKDSLVILNQFKKGFLFNRNSSSQIHVVNPFLQLIALMLIIISQLAKIFYW
jgi:hypothetical protein